MIHGEADTYIKTDMARALADRARGPCEFWVVDGAKHNQALQSPATRLPPPRPRPFFDAHLAGEPAPASSRPPPCHGANGLATAKPVDATTPIGIRLERITPTKHTQHTKKRHRRQTSDTEPPLRGFPFLLGLFFVCFVCFVVVIRIRALEGQAMSGLRQAVRRVLEFLIRKVVGKVVAWPVRRRLMKFEAATHDPEAVQKALLLDLIRYHAGTAFGRDHRFADVRTVADFQRRIPVAGYDYVEPYLARVRKGEVNALLADKRIHMFALTSGTTAGRKTIPVTDHYLDDYKRGWNLWGLKVLRDHRPVAFRPILQFSGDWQEDRTESGVPCGAVTWA